MADFYTLHSIDVDEEGGKDFEIDQIESFACDPAIALMVPPLAGGLVDQQFLAVQGAGPRMSFSSSAIAVCLTNLSIGGMAVATGGDNPGLDAYFKLYSNKGTVSAGSDHLRLRMASGLVLPRTLNIPASGPAMLTAEIIPISADGTTAPIVASASSLVGTPTQSLYHGLGPVKLNGTALAGISGVTIDFGITEQVLTPDGLLFPTHVHLISRRPSIRIDFSDVTALLDYGFSGTAQSATNSVIYLRKFAEGGSRVADGTAEHISFTINDGIILPTAASAGVGGPATAGLTVNPSYDGSNAILVVSTATVID